jgi:peptidoglycan/LPS O-acetylase OafA/YrhL
VTQTPRPPPTSPQPARIRELDGIRGLAILLVLVCHYSAIVNVPSIPLIGTVCRLLDFSWSGVDLFFVLSGFLIGGILLDAKTSANYYRTFYARRAHRILPLYWLWTGLFFLGVWFASGSTKYEYTEIFNNRIPYWTYPLFLQNFFQAGLRTFGCFWMSITWSLAVEEQFYLLFPSIVRRLDRRGLFVFLCVCIGMAPLCRLALQSLGYSIHGPFMLLPCRADSLALGVLVAMAKRDKNVWAKVVEHPGVQRFSMGFLLLGVALLVRWHPRAILNSVGFTLLALIYTCLLVVVLSDHSKICRWVFGRTFLPKLGTLTYGVYLFHYGLLHLAHVWILGSTAVIKDWPTLALSAATLALTLLLAEWSWRYFEGPLVQRGQRLYRYLQPNLKPMSPPDSANPEVLAIARG